jgi:Tol biopolymer transport system component
MIFFWFFFQKRKRQFEVTNMRIYRIFAVLIAVLGACVLFSGNASAQNKAYKVYWQSNRDGDNAIYELKGAETSKVSEPLCEHPSVTADGKLLLYSSFRVTDWGRYWNMFYMMDGKEHKVTPNFVYDELEPAVSHDGKFVAFASKRVSSLEIFTLPLDLGGDNDLQYQITENQKPDEDPCLAGSDKMVYWTGRTGNISYIFRAPARKGSIQRVSSGAEVWEEHPSISADSRYVVYAAITRESKVEEVEEGTKTVVEKAMPDKMAMPTTEERGAARETTDRTPTTETTNPKAPEGNSDIWVLDQTTGERTRLTSDESWEGNPCISADGEKIVFTSDRDGNLEIYMMNRDGTGLTRVTSDPKADDFATIS